MELSSNEIAGIEAWLTEVEEPRHGGPSWTPNPNRGDGYWCAVHGVSRCRCELRKWGKFGAAGVLPFDRATGRFLVNERSALVHNGGTLSTLGGAIDRDEDALSGALREAKEETGAEFVGSVLVEHATTVYGVEGSWSYRTFVIEVEEIPEVDSTDWESAGHEWLTLQELATRRLHPSFRQALPVIVSEMYYAGAFAA